MSSAEWAARIPGTALLERAQAQRTTRTAVRPMRLLAGAAWLAQAVVLGFLAFTLLGDATGTLLTVIGNSSSATWQVLLAIAALLTPYLAAGAIATLVRRDGGSLPLTAAAMVAAVLFAGLAEMGLTALVILFAGG